MTNNVLVIGGKGKTGQFVVQKLAQRGICYHIGTRQPQGEHEIAFDWQQPQLAAAAFTDIQAVYIVAPTNTSDHGAIVLPLLATAREKGVRRFVLLSASSLAAGDPMMGQIHAWLAINAPEWAVLRPTWFMQNFSQQQHLATIKQENAIYTATASGKVGFIDAQDIANVAVAALCAEPAWNSDFILTGPQALSYSDVAAVLSQQLGRTIRHIPLSPAQLVTKLQATGLDKDYAQILARMDSQIALGSEDRVTEHVWQLSGCQPTSLSDFVQRESQCW